MADADWLSSTLREAWIDLTPLLLVGWVLAAAVRSRLERAARTRASMRGTAVLIALHVAALPLAGYLSSRGSPHYPTAHGTANMFGVLAGITIGLALLFDGVLRAVRLEIPRLLADVIAAGAYLVGGLVVLHGWGVNLGGLIATSAVMTAVIGFALQDTLGNLIGGVALQMEKSVRPGDWIKVNDVVGRVVEVRWRQTTLESRDWETLIIPNSVLAKNQFAVLGRRLGQPTQWRRWIHFNVDFRHKPTDVIRIVSQALCRAPIDGVAAEPAPHCIHTDMRESFNSYAARYWLNDLSGDDPTDSLVRSRIVFALERAGIALTMPAHAVFLTQETRERKVAKERAEDVRGAAALRRVQLFDTLSDAELDELAAGLRYTPFAAGETLTRQGDVGHDLYLIDRGTVSIRIGQEGHQREVAVLHDGDFFGERSLMTGDRRSATTIAVTDVVCWRLAKSELEILVKRRPELAEEIGKTLAERGAELESARSDLTQAARKQRLETESQALSTRIRDFFGL